MTRSCCSKQSGCENRAAHEALVVLAALAMSSCGAPPASDGPASDTAGRLDEASSADPADAGAIDTGPDRIADPLAWAIAGDWRPDQEKSRDGDRNPAETLTFFEVEAGDVVVELWPGGGWYSAILAPYLNAGGGRLIAAGFDPDAYGGERRDRIENRIGEYENRFASRPDIFGAITLARFSGDSPALAAPGSADAVLTFRNLHNWMAAGYAEKAFRDAFDVLKPGGILGVVEHRLPSSETQDPMAMTGYVHEDYVKAAAKRAGFVFVESSEINANPKDTADHPFGVWTLPPNSRSQDRTGTMPEGFDPGLYQSIGESDRMTLKFRKPTVGSGEETPPLEPSP
ncbi:MAG: hypothetical protein AAGJ32_13175 [Pseudomonadota bacterium]